MKKPQTTITRGSYLAALGLYTMAKRHYRKSDEFAKELEALLGVEVGASHVSDAIFSEDGDFDRALERENIIVEAQ